MTDTVPVAQEDKAAADAYWGGVAPVQLVLAFARHRHEAELRGIKLGLEAAAKVVHDNLAFGVKATIIRAIRARLFNGSVIEAPADGRHGVNWSNEEHPFHIKEYEII